MYILSKQFLHDYRHDPRITLENCRVRCHPFVCGMLVFVLFIRIVWAEFKQNHCMMRASAIAFALLLTLVPVLASAAFLLASITDVDSSQIEKLLGAFLPFAPPTVLDYIGEFFAKAQKTRGVGIGLLIILTVGLFGLIEHSLNTIWKVRRPRSFFARLRTFTMVLVYGPLLLFCSMSLRRSEWLGLLTDRFFLFGIIPLALSVCAFSLFLWIVPNIKVRISSALLGGIAAAALFEVERRGYDSYVEFSLQMNNIYGTFGVLAFFLVSLFLVSLFVLIGAEICYTHQNFFPLLRAHKSNNRRVDDFRAYLSVRFILDIFRPFAFKTPPTGINALALRYELTHFQAESVVEYLIRLGLVHRLDGKDKLVPSLDLAPMLVREVLERLEDQGRHILPLPLDTARTSLEALFSAKRVFEDPAMESLTFGDLLARVGGGETPH